MRKNTRFKTSLEVLTYRIQACRRTQEEESEGLLKTEYRAYAVMMMIINIFLYSN